MRVLGLATLIALGLSLLAAGPSTAWQALVYDDSVTIGTRRHHRYIGPNNRLYPMPRQRLRVHHHRKAPPEVRRASGR
jgi:hypothetical protein